MASNAVAVTPTLVFFEPDAPVIAAIDPGNAQVTISVNVADDGGSPITGYTAVCIDDGGIFSDTARSGTSPTSPITVSGLTNGQTYVCLVLATNDIGNSDLSSASAPFAPFTIVAPFAPEITDIEPGNAQVSISVSVADDGGSPITGYTANCISESGNVNGTSPTSPITVTGLTNGQSYVCIVYATNAIGNSPLSSASAAFAPVAPPFGC